MLLQKCNAANKQLSCAVTICNYKHHAACCQHYLSQSKFNVETHNDVFCPATKACCSKYCVGNQVQIPTEILRAQWTEHSAK
jgi:hypothetical protein